MVKDHAEVERISRVGHHWIRWEQSPFSRSRFSGDELCYLISTNTEDFVYSTNGRLTVRKFVCTSVRDRNGMYTVTIGE